MQLGVGQVGCAQPCQPCCIGRVHELGDGLVVVCAVVGPATGAPAAQSGWVRPPAGRWVSTFFGETTVLCNCWVPARLQPRARGDRLVHSGPPVQVVKEVVHVCQDGRSRHAWGSRSGWSARFSSRFLRGDVQVRSLAVSVVLSCSSGRSGRECAPCLSTRR